MNPAATQSSRGAGSGDSSVFVRLRISSLPAFPVRVGLVLLLINQGWAAADATPPKTNNPPEIVRIQLKNGDRLSGRLLTDPLRLDRNGSDVQIPSQDLARLDQADNSYTTVVRNNGDTTSGRLTSDKIVLRLEFGPELSIPGRSIASITKTGPGPFTDLIVTDQSTMTNLEGLIWLPPGRFLMGSPSNEAGRDLDEGPQTEVTIAKGFWIGKCEVCQAEYQSVMGSNPSITTDDPRRPVERVSWFDAMEYCKKLTHVSESAGRLPANYAYRLPTEAEWEYACRAGSTTRYCCGNDENEARLDQYAWYSSNGESVTHPVGLKKPNAWGLYDMHGNVWEWCLDRWDGALPGGAVTNRPSFPQSGLRAARGGSWLYDAKSCRSANRDDYAPSNRCSDIGFRVVLAPLD